MEFFVAVVIVLLVLIYFMVVVLRSVVSEVNQKVNGYFLKHLEEYDDHYSSKLAHIKEMNAKEEKLSRTLRSLEREMEAYRVSPFYVPRPVPRDIYIPTARYIDNDFFVEYKVAKDKFKNKSGFTVGNAQKFLNMLMKDLYACLKQTPNLLCGYEDYFRYCHMPLDSYILRFVDDIRSREEIKKPVRTYTWSGLSDYDAYLDEQNDIRNYR